MKEVVLNPGAQKDFVTDEEARFLGYFGGIGSGKSFAGLVRGLHWSQQPVPKGNYNGPWGCVAASTYPMIEDVLMPLFFELVDGTGLLKQWEKGKKKATMKNNAVIVFRSLDRPNWRRGLNLSWFYIDEGREVTKTAWDVLVGRLRQPGFRHGGWVCSTPNGYDWQWQLFHEDSPYRHNNARWYHATTFDNERNLDQDYLTDLKASYSGKYYDQEVEGEFIGLMSGAALPHWSMDQLTDVPLRDELPLYSFWDFGIGDLGTCIFAQIGHEKEKLNDGSEAYVPKLHIVGAIEGKDMSAQSWADAYRNWLDIHAHGRRTDANYGDPAGKQRSMVTGTSMLDAMAAAGVRINAAPKKPQDYGLTILDNLMAGGRVTVDKTRARRVADAFVTHHWRVDDNGNRTGNAPVHDWTSHYVDACRYGAMSLLSHFPTRASAPQLAAPGPGTAGYEMQQVIEEANNDEYWLGETDEQPLAFPFPLGP